MEEMELEEIVERLTHVKAIWGICFKDEDDKITVEAIGKAIEILENN